jgi:hypothetical protein
MSNKELKSRSHAVTLQRDSTFHKTLKQVQGDGTMVLFIE